MNGAATIEAFVRQGIRGEPDLHAALQLAMELEFATIPPYLCAQWSIVHDPDKVEGVLHAVVAQEMAHLAMAGNVLAALGGQPRTAYADFVPCYPVSELPGGVTQTLPVDLLPMTKEQAAVFMQIEHPSFPPVAKLEAQGPATIGEFYEAIVEAIVRVQPAIDPTAASVAIGPQERLKTREDAITAIRRIQQEGEGLVGSPEQPGHGDAAHAHYYLFKELFVGRRLMNKDGAWSFSGAEVCLPEVADFAVKAGHDAEQACFRRALSDILHGLEAAWGGKSAFNVASMFSLEAVGKQLIRSGVRPDFVLSL